MIKKWLTNNIGYKILAIGIGFVLWLLIVNTTDPQTTRTIYNIPVTILNENKVLDGSHVYEIVSGKTTFITITGAKSVTSALSSSDFVATADFSELSITNAVPITVELSDAKSRYANQINISVKTSSMILELEDVESRVVNVNVELTGEMPENMIIDSISAYPSSVTFTAPASTMRRLMSVNVYLKYADIAEGGTFYAVPYAYDYEGNVIEETDDIKLDEESIAVTANVSYSKNVGINYEIYGTPAEGYLLKGTEISLDNVDVKGAKATIDELTEIFIKNENIDITDSTENVQFEIALKDYLPNGVSLVGDNQVVTITVLIEEEPVTEETTEDDTTENDENTDDQAEPDQETQEEPQDDAGNVN